MTLLSGRTFLRINGALLANYQTKVVQVLDLKSHLVFWWAVRDLSVLLIFSNSIYNTKSHVFNTCTWTWGLELRQKMTKQCNNVDISGQQILTHLGTVNSLPFQPQYPHTNSPDWSPTFPWRISRDNLIKDQSTSPSKIISLILKTFSLYYVYIYIENCLWLVLGLDTLLKVVKFRNSWNSNKVAALLLRFIAWRTKHIHI